MSKQTMDIWIDPASPTKKPTLTSRRRRFTVTHPVQDMLLFCTSIIAVLGCIAADLIMSPWFLVPTVVLAAYVITGVYLDIVPDKSPLTSISQYLSSQYGIAVPIPALESNLPISGIPASTQDAIKSQIVALLQIVVKQLDASSSLPAAQKAQHDIKAKAALEKITELSEYVEHLCTDNKMAKAKQKETAETERVLAQAEVADQVTIELESTASQLESTLILLSATASARAELKAPKVDSD